MDELTQRERLLIARGDVAIVTLMGVVNYLTPTQSAIATTAEQLRMAQARQTSTEETMLSVVSRVTTKTDETIQAILKMANESLEELKHFSGHTGLELDPTKAVENVLSALKEVSPVYKDKSDDELKTIMGLK